MDFQKKSILIAGFSNLISTLVVMFLNGNRNKNAFMLIQSVVMTVIMLQNMGLVGLTKTLILEKRFEDDNTVKMRINSYLTFVQQSGDNNLMVILQLGIVFQSVLLLMQSNQRLNLDSFLALVFHYIIQDYLTFMISGDILMVLFYNCISTILNFTAQMALDLYNFGFSGIFLKQETTGVLNITAFDTLSVSLFQFLLLGWIYSLVKYEKLVKIGEQMVGVTGEIIKRDRQKDTGLIMAKYQLQGSQKIHRSKLIDISRSSDKVVEDAHFLKVLYKNNELEQVLGQKIEDSFTLADFTKTFLLNRIVVEQKDNKYVKAIELIKKVLKKSISIRQSSEFDTFSQFPQENGKIDELEKQPIKFSSQFKMKNGQKIEFLCLVLREKRMILLEYQLIEKTVVEDVDQDDECSKRKTFGEETLQQCLNDSEEEQSVLVRSNSDKSFSELVEKQLNVKKNTSQSFNEKLIAINKKPKESSHLTLKPNSSGLLIPEVSKNQSDNFNYKVSNNLETPHQRLEQDSDSSQSVSNGSNEEFCLKITPQENGIKGKVITQQNQRFSYKFHSAGPLKELDSLSDPLSCPEDIKNIFLQKKVEQLSSQINTNRLFMNMVIHDMRNPTGSIEFGVQQSIENLKKMIEVFKNESSNLGSMAGSPIQVSDQDEEDESPEAYRNKVHSYGGHLNVEEDLQPDQPRRAYFGSQPPMEIAIQVENEQQLSIVSQDLCDIEVTDCQEQLENENVNIPKNFQLINQKNQNVMKYKDYSEDEKERIISASDAEVRYVERVVFKERPVKLMMERASQCEQPKSQSQDAFTQTFIQQEDEEIKSIDQDPSRCPKYCSKLQKFSKKDFQPFIDEMEILLENSMFSAKQLTTLINDLLDLAKLEKGQFSFNNQYFNLKDIIQHGIQQVQYMANQKQIKVKTTYQGQDDQILTNVYGDPQRFVQIMQNFLSNALKFTDKNGNIEISVRMLEVQEIQSDQQIEQQRQALEKSMSASRDKELVLQHLHELEAFAIESSKQDEDVFKYIKLKIDISDTGVGIKKENLSKLFMDFGKLDEHSKVNAQGTGLGLSICKRMIEKMGGTVTVDSIEGQGTTFTVKLVILAQVLPDEEIKSNNGNMDSKNKSVNSEVSVMKIGCKLQGTDKNVEVQDNPFSLKKKPNKKLSSMKSFIQSKPIIPTQLQCIVANDNHFQLMAVAYNLKNLSINIQMEAVNGLEALQYVQMNPNIKLDFILLDLDMPIMNGFEACKQIIDFYENSNMFKLEKISKKKSQGGGRKGKMDSSKSIAQSVNNIIEDMFMHPLMIAYSGLVNNDVRKHAREAGFKIVIEAPLTVQKIQAQILTNLEQRSSSIQNMKNEIMKNNLIPVDEQEASNEKSYDSKKKSVIEIIDEAPEQENYEEKSVSDNSSLGLIHRMNQLNGYNKQKND